MHGGHQTEYNGGRELGRYRLLRTLGEGGMAIVHLAYDSGLERHVAVKELRLAGDPEWAGRFLRESRLSGSLKHSNIVTVHDYLEADGVPYIAMEYVERGSLRGYVGMLTLPQLGLVLEDVLSGLRHAERHGVVHRDLKPENLLVTEEGRVKIADFGIAKVTSELAVPMIHRTAAGQTVGTPLYMAPEQALGSDDLGPWTDLYAVGCVAYELYTGAPPFADVTDHLQMMLSHINKRIPPATSVSPNAIPAVSDWIETLLVKDPRQRVQTAEAAWDALEEILIAEHGAKWRRGPGLPDLGELPERVPARCLSGVVNSSAVAAIAAEEPAPDAPVFISYTELPPSRPPVDSPVHLLAGMVPWDPSIAPPADAAHAPAASGVAGAPPAPAGHEAAPPHSPAAHAPAAPHSPDHVPAALHSPAASASAAPSSPAAHAPATGAPPVTGWPVRPPPDSRPPGSSAPGSPDRGLRGPLMVLGALVAVAVLVLALLPRGDDDGKDRAALEATPTAAPSTLSAGPLSVRLPGGWAPRAVEDLGGLALDGATAAGPAGDGAVVIGMAPAAATTPALLPEALAAVAPEPAAERLAGGLNAYRYDALDLGEGARAVVYVVPTSAGVATVACRIPEPADAAFADACGGVARSLAVRDARVFAAGPSRTYKDAVTDAVDRANAAQRPALQDLRVARTPAGQANALRGLRTRLDGAAAPLRGLELSPADAAPNRALAGALGSLADSYAALAAAARGSHASAYLDASSDVTNARRAANAALDDLRAAGYTDLPALAAPALPHLRPKPKPKPAKPKPTATPAPGPVYTATPQPPSPTYVAPPRKTPKPSQFGPQFTATPEPK